jgi:type I restriction enzyme S subunit
MKGYEKYKDSGIRYIGEIPNQWKSSKLKYFVNVITGNTPSTVIDDFFSEDFGIPWVKPSDLNEFKRITSSKQYLTEKGLYQSRLVRKGSVLIGGIGDIGKLGVAGCDLTTNQQIHSVEGDIKKVDDEFLKYLLYFSIEELQKNSSSVVLSILTKTKLLDLEVVLPSLEEQTQIAAFLDYKTNLIDATIEKKKRLIELLKEKRQAVINEAVTKGLNPNAPMKDSGLEWLGEIPEHWSLVPLRYLYNKIGSGVTPKGGGDVYVDEGVTFIRSQNVHFDGLRLDDVVKIDNDTHQKMSNSNVELNDVLLNITGASIGRCCVVNIDEEMNVNQHVCIIRVNEKINPNYLNVVLQSNVGQIQIKLLTTGGNREGLTHEAVKNMSIPLPDIETQTELLNTISEKLNNYDLINTKILFQIEKLQTYRQSLISEAVTGKIDVRDWSLNKQ